MIYTFLDTELEMIGDRGATVSTCFSLAAFIAGVIANIAVGYGFSNGPVSDVGRLMCYSLFVLVPASIGFVYAGWKVLRKKNELIDRIKKEHRHRAAISLTPEAAGQ